MTKPTHETLVSLDPKSLEEYEAKKRALKVWLQEVAFAPYYKLVGFKQFCLYSDLVFVLAPVEDPHHKIDFVARLTTSPQLKPIKLPSNSWFNSWFYYRSARFEDIDLLSLEWISRTLTEGCNEIILVPFSFEDFWNQNAVISKQATSLEAAYLLGSMFIVS